jgi:hypothetical protein
MRDRLLRGPLKEHEFKLFLLMHPNPDVNHHTHCTSTVPSSQLAGCCSCSPCSVFARSSAPPDRLVSCSHKIQGSIRTVPTQPRSTNIAGEKLGIDDKKWSNADCQICIGGPRSTSFRMGVFGVRERQVGLEGKKREAERG